MRWLFITVLSWTGLTGLLSGCGPARPGGDHDHEAEGHGHVEADEAGAPPGTVVIRPEMIRDLRVTTAKAELRAGGEGVAILGEVTVNEDAYAEAGSPVPARAVKALASVGDEVAAGQPLVALRSMDAAKARADYLTAKARALLAQKTLERKRNLTGDRIAASRELQEAEADAAGAEAGLVASRAALQALGISEENAGKSGEQDGGFVLRSPAAGTVLERSVVNGQAVEPAQALFRIADLSRLWVVVHAFERDAIRLIKGTPARLSLPAHPGRAFSGTIAMIGSQVEVSSRTVPVRIEVSNAEGLLRPGMSATAWLPVGGAGDKVVAVPTGALQRLADGWCAFVPLNDRTFEIRAVGRGRDLSGEVEILSGLKEGETVVVEGAFVLKAEAEKARGMGGHHDH